MHGSCDDDSIVNPPGCDRTLQRLWGVVFIPLEAVLCLCLQYRSVWLPWRMWGESPAFVVFCGLQWFPMVYRGLALAG